MQINFLQGCDSMLSQHFKIASLSQRSFVAAQQMMEKHKMNFHQEVRPGLFDCLRTLCPIEDEELVYEQLKSYAEGRRKQDIRTARPPTTENINTQVLYHTKEH